MILTEQMAKSTNTITINQILEKICKKGSIYDQIIDTIIHSDTNKQESKSAVISEIARYWLESSYGPIKAWNQGHFLPYFKRTVMNQVHSNTSSYHKNHRIKERYTFGVNFAVDSNEDFNGTTEMDIIDDNEDVLERKILMEERLEDITESLNKGNLKWIEGQLFREYYFGDKTYRQIEEEFGIDHVSVWKIVRSATNKVKNYLKTGL